MMQHCILQYNMIINRMSNVLNTMIYKYGYHVYVTRIKYVYIVLIAL